MISGPIPYNLFFLRSKELNGSRSLLNIRIFSIRVKLLSLSKQKFAKVDKLSDKTLVNLDFFLCLTNIN